MFKKFPCFYIFCRGKCKSIVRFVIKFLKLFCSSCKELFALIPELLYRWLCCENWVLNTASSLLWLNLAISLLWILEYLSGLFQKMQYYVLAFNKMLSVHGNPYGKLNSAMFTHCWNVQSHYCMKCFSVSLEKAGFIISISNKPLCLWSQKK